MKIIGVTGHRDIVVTNKLKEEIEDFFIDLKNKKEKIKLLSPLADGADRLVADIYLRVFRDKAHLIVPMPFSKEIYINDFSKDSREEFLNYLKLADKYFEVENSENDNYKSVGVYVVDNSDILLALWDGTFNNKSGGTGDIVKYAKEIGKEIIHFKTLREGDI